MQRLKHTYRELAEHPAGLYVDSPQLSATDSLDFITLTDRGIDAFDSLLDVDHAEVVESGDLSGINEDVQVVNEVATWGDRGNEKAVLVAIDLHGVKNHFLTERPSS